METDSNKSSYCSWGIIAVIAVDKVHSNSSDNSALKRQVRSTLQETSSMAHN